jgi:hypothetical protein
MAAIGSAKSACSIKRQKYWKARCVANSSGQPDPFSASALDRDSTPMVNQQFERLGVGGASLA